LNTFWRTVAATTVVLWWAAATTATAPARQPSFPMRGDFFVAPNGNDGWSGTRAAPLRYRTDGPFATIARAQAAVRALRAGPQGRGPATPIRVFVRGGTYFLDGPMVFTPEDGGGGENAPVVYAAYKNEKPVISGGRRVTGWTRAATGRWQTTLPDVKNGAWNFAQLFVGGERRYRPRLPKGGYYFVTGQAAPSPESAGKGHDRFRFRPGDLRGDWANLGDVEILPFQIWTMPRFHIKALDTGKNVVTLAGRSFTTESYGAFPKGNRFLVENVKEALGEPGTWYLDRPSGVLTYVPRPGESPEKTVVVAPRLENVVVLRGDVARRRWVRHLAFRGLTFAHTNWTLPPSGHNTPQAEITLSGAILADGARDCVWENCRVRSVGGYGIELREGCRNNRIVGCELTDLAAGGIKIGTTGIPEDDEAVTGHTTVENCRIAHGGRMHPAGVGVWIGHSPHNRIERNTIHDLYYTGISPGWSWGYGPSRAHHNTIAYNHIFDIGQGVLSDMGGIYTLGVSPGTVLHHNRIHGIESLTYGGWGIYFDEGTTDVVARDNVVYRTRSAGFHQHYGKNNLVTNNVFAFGGEAQLMRTRAEEHLSFTIERNLVVAGAGAPLLGSNWTGDNFRLDHNLYWNYGKQPVTFVGMALDEWQKKGQDVHSLVADPRFVDPEKGDFRLKPDSPARQIGFRPIDLGRTGKPGYVPGKNPPRAFPPPPPPRPQEPVAEDFEDVPVGERAPDAATVEEPAGGSARVGEHEESPAQGTRSLKFADAPGQQHRYNPHVFYQPTFANGILTGRFDLRIERNAVFSHEWRDAAGPYRTGPSLRVDGAGVLWAGPRRLMELPHDRWVRFEITCRLGEAATGVYDLTVRLPGRVPPRRFPGLPCADRGFRALRWYGFVAEGTEAAAFFVDNIALGAAATPAGGTGREPGS
jgi:hypothetical protein